MCKLFLVIVLAFCLGCEKEITRTNKPAIQLLTQIEWILTSYGYDKDKDGVIDPSEENIKDCEKDNSYLFKQDGSGNIFENALNCGNGISDHSFNWQFVDNETGIDFVFGRADILLLNEHDFIISDNTINNANEILIMRFRH